MKLNCYFELKSVVNKNNNQHYKFENKLYLIIPTSLFLNATISFPMPLCNSHLATQEWEKEQGRTLSRFRDALAPAGQIYIRWGLRLSDCDFVDQVNEVYVHEKISKIKYIKDLHNNKII